MYKVPSLALLLPVIGVLLLVVLSLLPSSNSFCSVRSVTSPLLLLTRSNGVSGLASSSLSDEEEEEKRPSNCQSRRDILSRATTTAAASAWCCFPLAIIPSRALASPDDDVKETRALIETAKRQLDAVPALIEKEKWDSVRGLLTEAPLRDCWSKSTPLLKKYAEALGETPKGDELAALEGREELLQHLRFLDMAVYNNVFNPISTEGTTGASKALIDSYYNDPTREFDASMKAITGLLELSNN